LDTYKNYKLKKAKSISNPKAQKKIIDFVKLHLVELDTVFQAYNEKTHFNFNTADTIFMIYYSPAESPFTSDIIMWSGPDTISYRQEFVMHAGKNKRIIKYQPFIQQTNKVKGFKVITETDSLMTLVAKRDYVTISHLGDGQSILDGSIVSIYIGYKVKGQYKIESIFPKKFMIRDVYRKE
jgi:hypothetical protein